MAGTSAGGGAGAIEKRCPICLEDFDDKTFIDACFHCFCFRCIVQWSQVTTTCPMCKTSFTTLIHKVQANDNYTQYKVEPKTRSSDQEISIGEARRFRYRTTRVPGQPRHSAPEPPDQQETARERERRERERQRKRQLQSNPASDERRQAVYSLGLLAQPPRTEGRKERVRDISAAFFRKNPACTHRLVPWLTREIRVLLGPDHVQFVIQLVLSLIDKVELEGEEFHKHIQPFLLTRTSHFLHELISFARSPFNMAAYDHRVRYEWPLSRVRDEWDPEATVNVSTEHSPIPGPSGNSQSDRIQERLFEELTATRWDDSPPFLHLSSPILIHGSDSEDEEDNVHTLPETVSTSNMSTSTAIHTPPLSTSGTSSATFGDYAHTEDATLIDATAAAGGVGRDEESGQEIGGTCDEGGGDGESGDRGEGTQEDESKNDNFEEGTVKQNDEGEQNHPPSPIDAIRKSDSDASPSAISATPPKAPLGQVQPTLSEKSVLLNTSSAASCSNSVKCKSEVQDEDEMCIVINAESDSEYLPLETAIPGSAGSSGSKLKVKESAMKTTSRHTCKGKAPSREREGLENKKHKSRKERDKGKKWKHSHKEHKRRRQSRSDDGKWHSDNRHKRSKHNLDRCYSSSSESSSGLERQRFSPESRREKKHRRIRRRPSLREVESYYARERCHRSRLYSDDYVYSKTKSEHKIRQYNIIRETVAHKEGVSASSLNTARVTVDDKKPRRKSRRDGECRARYSTNRDHEKLRKELSGLDQEIVEQKRKALRAMLRCERLKLLHRELQGKDLPEGELSSLGQPLAINERTPTGEVEQQLAELDRAIMDGKRRVLYIMKKMEEQAPQSDDSSN